MNRFQRILSVLLIIMLSASIFAFTAVSAGADQIQHTITFDVQGIGETPDPVTVSHGESYQYLGGTNNPTADGYVFHCWVTRLDYEPDEVSMSNTAAYLETPVTGDMTLYAVWFKLVDHIDITVDSPVPGDVIGTERYESQDHSFAYQSPRPRAQVLTEGVQLTPSNWFDGPNIFWLEDADNVESIFKGTFESGKVYGVDIAAEPLFGYEFADHLTVTVNGVVRDRLLYTDRSLCHLTLPILCEKQSAPAKSTQDQPAAAKPDSENPNAIPTGVGSGLVVVLSLLTAIAALPIFRSRVRSAAVRKR